jgi:hypothetical protein
VTTSFMVGILPARLSWFHGDRPALPRRHRRDDSDAHDAVRLAPATALSP